MLADQERWAFLPPKYQNNTAPLLLALARMVVCDEVCVWVVGGFPDDEGSLRALLEAPNCMAVVVVVVAAAVVVVGSGKSGGGGGSGGLDKLRKDGGNEVHG